ncbi:MAG: protein kinase [Firmicutes bacterium]|nr:protein kinase [Bacillota bacterium]
MTDSENPSSTPAASTPANIGRYEIKGLLGSGAMGSVYLAEDPRIKRRLAIKVVKVDAIRSEEDRAEFLARFQREAEVSGVLNDPGIVTIYDVGDSELGPFLAMEFVAGKALDSMLKSGELQALELPGKLRIAAGIAAALDHAHRHGIVHRDVKPGNVMMTEEGRPKLMDFGIAKREDANLTQTGTFLGTPSYASPEQIREGRATFRSDIFSFGVLVFEMLSGSLPFPGSSINTILYKIVNEPPVDVKPPVLGLLPGAWERVFSKVLAKNPEVRYESCAAFLRDLMEMTSNLRAEDRSELLGLLRSGVGGAPILVRGPEATMAMPVKASSGSSGLKWLWALPVAALLGGAGWYFLRGTDTKVKLETTPVGAKILKDGADLGHTPLALAMKVGEKVTLEKPGYEPETFAFSGSNQAPRIELRPRISEEILATTPAGAKVVMDETPLEGETPMKVSWDQSKPHRITFTKEGLSLSPNYREGETPGTQIYTLVERREALTTGEIKTVDANAQGFVRATGTFTAKVRVDGKEMGEVGGSGRLALSPGHHRLELSSPGHFYSETKDITVQPGQTTTLSLPALVAITVFHPSGDVVVIDGRSTGVDSDGSTPIRLAPGRHTISIQGKSASQTLDLKTDQNVRFKL